MISPFSASCSLPSSKNRGCHQARTQGTQCGFAPLENFPPLEKCVEHSLKKLAPSQKTLRTPRVSQVGYEPGCQDNVFKISQAFYSNVKWSCCFAVAVHPCRYVLCMYALLVLRHTLGTTILD